MIDHTMDTQDWAALSWYLFVCTVFITVFYPRFALPIARVSFVVVDFACCTLKVYLHANASPTRNATDRIARWDEPDAVQSELMDLRYSATKTLDHCTSLEEDLRELQQKARALRMESLTLSNKRKYQARLLELWKENPRGVRGQREHIDQMKYALKQDIYRVRRQEKFNEREKESYQRSTHQLRASYSPVLDAPSGSYTYLLETAMSKMIQVVKPIGQYGVPDDEFDDAPCDLNNLEEVTATIKKLSDSKQRIASPTEVEESIRAWNAVRAECEVLKRQSLYKPATVDIKDEDARLSARKSELQAKVQSMQKDSEYISPQRQLNALREKANNDEKEEKTKLSALQASLESSEKENSRQSALYSQSKKSFQDAKDEKERHEKRPTQVKCLAENIPVLDTRTDAPAVGIRVTQSTVMSALPTSKQAPQVIAVPTIVPMPPRSEPGLFPRQQPVSEIGSPPSIKRTRPGPAIFPTAHTSQTLSRVSIGFNKSAFGFPVLTWADAAPLQDVVMEDAHLSHVVVGPPPAKDVPMDVDDTPVSHSSPAAPPAWDNEIKMTDYQTNQPPAQVFDNTQPRKQPFVSIVNNTQSQSSTPASNNTQPPQAPGSFAQQTPIAQNFPTPVKPVPSQVKSFTSFTDLNQIVLPAGPTIMGSLPPVVAPIAGPPTSTPSTALPAATQMPTGPNHSQEAQAYPLSRPAGGILKSSVGPSSLAPAAAPIAGPSTSTPSSEPRAQTRTTSDTAYENPEPRPQARLPSRAAKPSAGPRAPMQSPNRTLVAGHPNQPAQSTPNTHTVSQQAPRATPALAAPQGEVRRQGGMSEDPR